MTDDNNKSLELDHEYDGIKELDNPLPRWWLITFYGAIIYSTGYFIYYQLGSGPTIRDNYKENLSHHKSIQSSYLEKIKQFDLDKFKTYYKNEDMIEVGHSLFENNCMSCHKKDAAGDIGPNLTDTSWLYAEGTPETIYPFILTGNPDAGMPSWADKLDKDSIYAILSYIMSIQGITHKKEKEAQGDEFPKWKL